jgi:hypothetical protein
MAISKNERRLSIWIGIAIGIAFSSMLVRYALQKKAQQTNERPGNYKSLACAVNGTPFDPIPEQITEHIPHGIVIYFESNQSNSKWNKLITEKSWTIESAGSFRSERLFVLAREISSVGNKNFDKQYFFHRCSELYLLPNEGATLEQFEKRIDPKEYKVIGENSKSGEWILQIKDFSPNGLKKTKNLLSNMDSLISKVSMIPCAPFK